MTARVVNKRSGEPFDIYIGRPSRWGNPFTHLDVENTRAEFKVGSRDEAVDAYRAYLWLEVREGRVKVRDLARLHDKTLACWCAPQRCHGEILAAAAEWASCQLHKEAS